RNARSGPARDARDPAGPRAIAREADASLAGITELCGPESAVSGPLRAVLLWVALWGGGALLCGRARRRPARARCGLPLSLRYADVLASGPGPHSGRSVKTLGGAKAAA